MIGQSVYCNVYIYIVYIYISIHRSTSDSSPHLRLVHPATVPAGYGARVCVGGEVGSGMGEQLEGFVAQAALELAQGGVGGQVTEQR